MKFVMSIVCDNPAFADNPEIELARILRDAAKKLSEQAAFAQQLYDINGNKVGKTSFVEASSEKSLPDAVPRRAQARRK